MGGSDARVIMGDDEASLVRLWREKRGEIEPEDLSGNLIVQFGVVTEELNRAWYQRNSGLPIKDVQGYGIPFINGWPQPWTGSSNRRTLIAQVCPLVPRASHPPRR